nr:50S ribosomal protein L15P [uncultured archaeon]
MKTKKRKKATRFRASHTHGRGFKKKARGKGHQGGKGMAGTGKRGDQKKTLILNLPEEYFGKVIRLAKKPRIKLKEINLSQISQNLNSFVKGDKKEINLSGYKILSSGDSPKGLIIKASSASKMAMEKIKKAGGSIILPSIEGE